MRIADNVVNKGNDSYLFSSEFGKAKLFPEILFKNITFRNTGISLTALSSRTNLKLRNVYVTFKMVEKVIIDLDLCKASGFDYISVVVLKSCQLELLFDIHLKESFS